MTKQDRLLVGTEIDIDGFGTWGIIEMYDPDTDTYWVEDRTGEGRELDATLFHWGEKAIGEAQEVMRGMEEEWRELNDPDWVDREEEG